MCERSKTLNQKPKEHECFMNWKKSSTCMEADGIAEGFLKSIELHGLKFNRLIGKRNVIKTTYILDFLI